MKIRKLICIALAVCLVLMLSVGANAAEEMGSSGTCGENLTWTLDDAGKLVISGTGEMDNYAFRGEKEIKTVVIGDGVTCISEAAFASCTNLTKVTIGTGVTRIEDGAFQKCYELTAVTIPDSVREIGEKAFYYCQSMTRVSIGSAVSEIDDEAFYGCDSLEKFLVDEDNAFYCSDSYGVLFNKKMTELVQAPGALSGTYKIPAGVVEIGDHAFKCADLTGVVIPDGVVEIDDLAFGWCGNLKKVTIPATVREIGDQAFYECERLAEITFLGDAPEVGYEAFELVEANAYYPVANKTWTAEAMERFGGALTWIPADESGNPLELAAPIVRIDTVASTGKIKLNWGKVTGAAKYRVYRATSRTGTYKLLKTTTSTSFINTGAVAGKTYYYYVVAVASDGDKSDKSEIVSRTCDLARPVVSISNVAKTGKIKLTWKAIDGAVSYKVYRAASKTGEYKLMKTTTSTSYINTSATAGKLYYYKVVAVAEKSAANSAYSSYKSRTCDLPRPDVSIALKNGKPRLTWEAIDGAVSYQIYRATSKTGTYSLLKTTTGTSFTNTGAKSGTTYYYKVVAVHERSAANSAYSLIDSIKSK